jgi:hypothetical protein
MFHFTRLVDQSVAQGESGELRYRLLLKPEAPAKDPKRRFALGPLLALQALMLSALQAFRSSIFANLGLTAQAHLGRRFAAAIFNYV